MKALWEISLKNISWDQRSQSKTSASSHPLTMISGTSLIVGRKICGSVTSIDTLSYRVDWPLRLSQEIISMSQLQSLWLSMNTKKVLILTRSMAYPIWLSCCTQTKILISMQPTLILKTMATKLISRWTTTMIHLDSLKHLDCLDRAASIIN